MGEGIFLLVIKDLFDDCGIENGVRKKRKRNCKPTQNFIRYTDYINNKPFYIVEVGKNFLCTENMQKLLYAYKGCVLINENLPEEPFCEYLFDAREYYLRALLSSLSNRVKYEKDINSICIKNENILICEEVFEIIKNVRTVHFIVSKDIQTEVFQDECLKRYGTFIKIGEYCCFDEFDVCIDLSQMTSDGKCEIFFNGKTGLLYPDSSFFDATENVKKLLAYGVDKKIACAICNSKKT